MANLTLQDVTTAGLAPSFTAASASGDTFANNERTVLYVKNGGASNVTVTFVAQKNCNFGFKHDLTVTVPAKGELLIGPLPRDRFNDEQGLVHITYSDVTSVTVAALDM